ncbi:PREDICTED: uncharacterized protein LOC105557164 [Vollenhovia emeryi]|uniref:uncharacterized protein LOC105557164 n=1 Tax=Vollenhovia emeryi TaxID=411798 RepID=UPI0005F38BB8|nr:PREDICTED: uncharacterized protein LOC105557164 [Vollenhovia emeryi]
MRSRLSRHRGYPTARGPQPMIGSPTQISAECAAGSSGTTPRREVIVAAAPITSAAAVADLYEEAPHEGPPHAEARDAQLGQGEIGLAQVLSSEYVPPEQKTLSSTKGRGRSQRFHDSSSEVSINCNFEKYLPTALRNELVFGLSCKRTQARLLEIQDLNLDKALKIATTMELSEKGTLELQGDSASINIAAVKKSPKYKKNPKKQEAAGSSACGKGHLASKCTLNQNVRCNACGKASHLERVCFQAKQSTNLLEEVLNLSGDQNKARAKIKTTLEKEIESLGRVKVNVKSRDKQISLDLFLTPGERKPLLGREWIYRLQNMPKIAEVYKKCVSINTIESTIDSQVALLSKDYEANLDPKSLKNKGLHAELNLKEGKINVSRWATPIVPVLKKNNQVRICGDFSVMLNPNLIVDELPLPTTNELFTSMEGCTIFSKIDLQNAYLQLEVSKEDCELLTLNTHRGLYKCKRLMYGIASAPAIWQRTIEMILHDIPGVVVYLDDIRIGSKSKQEHWQKLKEVSRRLQKHNVKINFSKSEFAKDRMQYYRQKRCTQIFRKDGGNSPNEKTTKRYRIAKSAVHANADCLSRLPLPSSEGDTQDAIDALLIDVVDSFPIEAKIIKEETQKDTDRRKLIVNGVLMRRHRVVIPTKLRNKILLELHMGHFGMTKMKGLAGSYLWWSGLDQDIENIVKNCANCNMCKNSSEKVVHCWEEATEPFQRVHVGHSISDLQPKF